MNYMVLLIGDYSTVVPINTLNKWDVILHQGTRDSCTEYSDKWNRQLLQRCIETYGLHKSDNTPQPQIVEQISHYRL